MTNAQPSTLPDWLRHQAQHRPHAVALRHKRLGAWHALSWQDVATAVEHLAAGLAQHGFTAGDALLLVSHSREEALLLSLAAQWNGGVAIPLDPQLAGDTLRACSVTGRPAPWTPEPCNATAHTLSAECAARFFSSCGISSPRTDLPRRKP